MYATDASCHCFSSIMYKFVEIPHWLHVTLHKTLSLGCNPTLSYKEKGKNGDKV